MSALTDFLAQNWIVLVIVGSLLLFIIPWIFVWRYRSRRKQLLQNGRSAQAKILEITASGLTIGASSSSDSGNGNMRGINLLLEIYPEGGQPYQVKTREQIHLLDMSRLSPGMLVAVKVDPNNRPARCRRF